jgi:hypothetical protein
MLQIAPEKVAHVIVRAREFDAKVAPWDDHGSGEREDEVESILEDTPGDLIGRELKDIHRRLECRRAGIAGGADVDRERHL